MKRRIIALVSLSILLFSFIGCNADASAGLFYQLAHAKEPVKIRYTQIIGTSSGGDTLYFLTDEGVYARKQSADSAELVVQNKKGLIINAAALQADDTLYLLANGPEDSALLYRWDSTTPDALPQLSVADYALKGLYANSLIGAQKTSDGTMHLGTVDSTTEKFTSSLAVSRPDVGNYITSLMQPGKSQQAVDADNPLLTVYFAPATDTYTTYYYDGTSSHKLTGIADKPATFTLLDNKFFVLTSTGILYGSTAKPAGETAMVELAKLNRVYTTNAFIYGITAGDTYNLITKSTQANEGFTVLKFAKTIFSADQKKVENIHVADGYGSHFSNVLIVDALLVDEPTHEFLIATLTNGMMSVTFTALDDKDKNSGSATAGEEYEF